MGLIISEYQEESYILKLQTSERNDIENIQYRNVSIKELSESDRYENSFSLARFKGQLTQVYNCHGLTFASRRTWIYNTNEIDKILKDDKYIEIKDEKDVLPGDIVTYSDESGITHSGIVVQVDLPKTEVDLINIIILSKWGRLKEVIHNVHYSPYSNGLKKYWRVNHGFRII